jgi:hypothetical protein
VVAVVAVLAVVVVVLAVVSVVAVDVVAGADEVVDEPLPLLLPQPATAAATAKTVTRTSVRRTFDIDATPWLACRTGRIVFSDQGKSTRREIRDSPESGYRFQPDRVAW